MAEWMRKAELSLDRQEEAVTRDALERYLSFHQLALEAERQLLEQKDGVEGIKSLLARLVQKLEVVKSKGEILAVRDRRSCSLDKAWRLQPQPKTGCRVPALINSGRESNSPLW